MSIISSRIRAYVADPSVSNHYGEWGALRIDQRREIRELCDVCDMFEKTADEYRKEIERLNQNLKEAHIDIKEHMAEIERLKAIGKDEIEYRKVLEKYSASLAIKEVGNKILELFPSDKDFTTISRFTVKQIVKEMTEQKG